VKGEELKSSLRSSLTLACSPRFLQFTWAATGIAAAVLVLKQDYKGDKNGDHALADIQRGARRLFEGFVTGDFAAPAQPPQPSAAPVTSPIATQDTKDKMR
jgi:hypothetical protein